jgi:nucleotide-binding universal stress UspA family protein
METIVVGYDGSEAAKRALERAAGLAQALPARLVVVSVSGSAHVPLEEPVLGPEWPTLVPGGAAGPMLGPLPPPAASEPAVAPTALAEHLLDQARAALARRRLDVEYVAEMGAAAERLLEVAEERDADLIVVGREEHGFVERLLARPVEETVARKAERDVLLVH